MICAACLHQVEQHTSVDVAGYRLCLDCRKHEELRDLCYELAKRRRAKERRRRRHMEPRLHQDEAEPADPFEGEELRR